MRQVVFRQYPVWLWAIGLICLALAALVDDTWDRTLVAVIGVAFVVMPSTLSVTLDRATGIVAIHYRSLFRTVSRQYPLRDIASVRVAPDSERERMYRVQLVLRTGEVIPLQSGFSIGKAGKERAAERLRAALTA